MNYIILFGTAKVRKIKSKWVNILVSSIIGALCSSLMLVISSQYQKTIKSTKVINTIEIIVSIILKIILSIIMIIVAFKSKANIENKKEKKSNNEIKNRKRNSKSKHHNLIENLINMELFKTIVVFYLISFVTGGIAISLMYSNSFIIGTSANATTSKKMSQQTLAKISFLAGLTSLVITLLAFKYNKSKLKKEDLICDILIKIGEKRIKLKALVDTGNSLTYNHGSEDVIVVEKSKIFSKQEFKDFIEKGGSENTKLRLIPFKSIGKENGVLIGIKPDEVTIIKDENKLNLENIIIGMYDKKIGTTYSAIIGINLL